MKLTSLIIGLIATFGISTQAITQQEDNMLDFMPAILSGVKTLPKPINFKVRLPSLSSANEITIDLAQWDIPNNGTQAVKTTDNLQAAIDDAINRGFNRIIVPDGTYLIGKFGNAIYQRGLELHSDMELILSPNTIIKMVPNDKWNYCVIAVNRKENVIIRGGTIIGDRNEHIYTPRAGGGTAHDEGHGICIQSSSKTVLVEGMNIRGLTGDGLLLVNEIEDVTIRKNKISNNRRQGISIVGSLRIQIERNEIHHIRGTSPQFGIDIEGNGRTDKDILIRKNYFHHNRGGDIVSSTGKNVFIIDNVMEQGTEGVRYIDGPIVTWERTNNVIAHNKITMLNGSVNGRLGYIQYSGGRDNNPEITYVHDNVCNGCGMYMYRAGGADIRRNKFFGYFLSLADFTDATVIDNIVTRGPPGTPQYCWIYRIRNTTGTASGNTADGNTVNLPLSSTPWTSQCLRR